MNRRQFLQAAGCLSGAALPIALPAVESETFDWRRVRADFDFNPRHPQLSTVVSGLMPRPVRNAVVQLMDQDNELRRTPGSTDLPDSRAALRARVRARAASFIGTSADHVALTRNTTEGIATVVANLPLRRGDEILASTHEHPPYYGLLAQRANRDCIVVRTIAVPTPAPAEDAIVEAYASGITARTRLILLTHVAITGQVLPVKRICALARERDVQVLVDGALAVAHVPIDVDRLGCDYYAGNFHKWAGGPPGTGIFYVRPDRIALLPSLFGSAEIDVNGGPVVGADRGRMSKYTSVGRHPASHADALGTMFDWLDGIGTARREARIRDLAASWVSRARNVSGFRSAAGAGLSASLVAWELEGRSSVEVAEHLWARHGLVLGVTDPLAGLFGDAGARSLLLTNTALFTNDDDIDRLLAGIEDAVTGAG